MVETEVKSVHGGFSATAERRGDEPFLHIPAVAAPYNDGRALDFSYAEMLEAAERARAGYEAAGYGNGHRVALLLQNRADFFIHWLALNALQASVVPINSEMEWGEQAYMLELSGASLVVTLTDLAERIRRAAAERQVPIFVCDDAAATVPQAGRPVASWPSGRDAESALMFTSGSTGRPKGCMLTNDYYLLSGWKYLSYGGYCALEDSGERILTPLPLEHTNAMSVSAMAAMLSGNCLIQLDRFHPRSWWQTVRDSETTVLHYLGVMPAMLLQLPPSELDHNPQVKFGFGAGVNPAHHIPFEERFGFPLVEAWAMTETGCHNCIIANVDPRHRGTGCFGRPMDHIETRIVDEQGVEVARGEPGELLLRGSGDNPKFGFFAGYFRNPEATAEAWEGGWMHTGDVVREMEDGSLCFIERRKNIVRRSGENISPLEVEAVLADFDPAEVYITAAPDEIRGDEVMAIAVPEPGTEPTLETAAALFDHVMQRMVYFKAPGYVVFLRDESELPLTPSQKPRRGELKKMAAALLESWNEAGEPAADTAEAAGMRLFDLRSRKKRPRKS